MQRNSTKKSAPESCGPNWNIILKEFHNLKNTFINLYDAKYDIFVFVNNSSDQLSIRRTELLGKGLNSWTEFIHKADLKKAEMLFLAPQPNRITNYQSIQNRLYYRIKNKFGQQIHVLHEQRYIKSGRLFILNMITDITEKLTAKRLIYKLHSELNPNEIKKTQEIPKDFNGDISGRENEVLQLIATGLSSKEIADKLFISNHTAISHRKNLIEKFNVKNTAELIKEASQILWLC